MMKIAYRRRRLLATVALTLVGAPLIVTLSAPAGTAQAEGPLRYIGELPEPAAPGVRTRTASIATVDGPGRRMYYVYTDTNATNPFNHVVTYDLNPRIPKPIATGRLAPDVNILATSPYAVALDRKRQQLTFITGNMDAAGHALTIGNPTLTVYSAAANKVTATWNLATTVPGFFPFGVTYSAADDRLYLIGEFAGSQYVAASTFTFGSKAAGTVTAVIALNPDTGALLWSRPIPECQQALFTLTIGGLLARSEAQDALYFACVTGGTPNGFTYPGQAGIVRLHIDPKATNSAQAAAKEVDFYAISGNYFNGASTGIAAFDRLTDRFYLQSLAPRTPGAWVFDGRLSAWVGFVSAPSSANRYIGLNESLGHLYMGMFQGGSNPGATDGILVADVRQTPVPAGESAPIVTSNFIVTDPGSRRLFIRPFDAPTTLKPYRIYEDVTPVSHGAVETDWDAQTTNTPDNDKADASYSAGAAGYGAQAVEVGGTSGATSAINAEDLQGVKGGTRALMTARMGNLDLRENGAMSSTQAALPDYNSIQEYEAQRGPWPYPVTTCLDSGGGKVEEAYRDDGQTAPANGGASGASCDHAKHTAAGYARMGASSSAGTTVQKSSHEADAVRTTKDGATTTTDTSADGVRLEVAGGFTVRLSRVAATATTKAHGQPGTTYAEYRREVDGVRITDMTGKTVYTAPGCDTTITRVAGQKPTVKDTCTALGATLSRVLKTRLRVSFPMPELVATPKGAYAAVQQGDGDYFQQSVVNDQGVIYRGDSAGPRPVPAMVTEVYNDSTERSRTVSLFAATQSYALFTIVPAYDPGPAPNPRPQDGPAPGPVPGSGGGDGTGASGGSGLLPGDASTGGGDTAAGPLNPTTAGTGSVAGNPVLTPSGFMFMRRSLRDTALLVLLAGLMLGGAGTMWRRRRLVEVLVTVPRKEAL